jgi:hypothetical protein
VSENEELIRGASGRREHECSGSGRQPRAATVSVERGSQSAECDSCGGRFHLDEGGLIPRHVVPAPLHHRAIFVGTARVA